MQGALGVGAVVEVKGVGGVVLAFAFGVGEASCVTKVTQIRKGGAYSPRKRN